MDKLKYMKTRLNTLTIVEYDEKMKQFGILLFNGDIAYYTESEYKNYLFSIDKQNWFKLRSYNAK